MCWGMVSFPSLMFFEGIEWVSDFFALKQLGGGACPHFDHFVNWIYVGLCNPIHVFKRLKPQRSPWGGKFMGGKKKKDTNNTAEKVTWTLKISRVPKRKQSPKHHFSGAVTTSFRKRGFFFSEARLPTNSVSRFQLDVFWVFRWTICTEDALYIEISNLRMYWCQMICHLGLAVKIWSNETKNGERKIVDHNSSSAMIWVLPVFWWKILGFLGVHLCRIKRVQTTKPGFLELVGKFPLCLNLDPQVWRMPVISCNFHVFHVMFSWGSGWFSASWGGGWTQVLIVFNGDEFVWSGF